MALSNRARSILLFAAALGAGCNALFGVDQLVLDEPAAAGGDAGSGEPGKACDVAAACASGQCVDGVCCESACAGPCEACVASKTGEADGACAPVLSDTDPDDECALSESACTGAACSGAAACQPLPAATTCRLSRGPCDLGEQCTGDVGDACPTDGFAAAGSECAGGLCNGKTAVCNVCPVALALGRRHSCARKSDGTLWCWGDNERGQLGVGSATDKLLPVQVNALGNDVAEVALGEFHSCARKSDGTVWCWGDNERGQLGDGSDLDKSVPVLVGALGNDVVSIGLGVRHSCALKSVGSVYCWGDNEYGQLAQGNYGMGTEKSTPVKLFVSGTELALGGYRGCARNPDKGFSYCWGFNGYGEFGNGENSTSEVAAVLLPPATNAAASSGMALGTNHTCGRAAGGKVSCWGANDKGQLGDGTTSDKSTPVPIAVLAGPVKQIALGARHSCALQAGTIRCWGANGYGQLGDGTQINELTPTKVNGLADGVLQVAAGDSHTCAIAADGAVWCWGANGSGQLGDGTMVPTKIPVQTMPNCL